MFSPYFFISLFVPISKRKKENKKCPNYYYFIRVLTESIDHLDFSALYA